ncbi:proline--tRNA ligase [Candidatus Purcelliella pentastirinorum]|uniref:Proline--tRNA ligase n=1 Tax=Candidatus Purcelliella pentastirinorum TaxID=472834 RepID=A0AAX3N8W6_9ENTR|nr:proline--tRNA ligase [Candidatus Purcelliella pentastirinorum]WDI78547.1 proline--tRNA ligase [Candidatus Purcelliella pentastirinorum]
MKTTKYFISTLKNISSQTKTISYRLMIKSGMIRKISSGLYAWLPIGIRVIQNIKKIIREEMNKIGCIEINTPIMQPSTLWEKSKRLKTYGSDLIKLKDRKKKKYILAPTHEEIITYLIKKEIKSYKKLPIILYQIQTKFRDEIRPRFGVIRSREFIMKDAYSFHENYKSLTNKYKIICKTYKKIFNRIGLKVYKVHANSGNIGGNISHEFQALANDGEDTIAISKNSNYKANIEVAKSITPKKNQIKFQKKIQKIDVNNINNLEELTKKYKISKKKIIKVIIVKSNKKNINPFTALLLRSDHQINKTKIKKIKTIKQPLKIIDKKTILKKIGIHPIYLGPIKLNMPIIADNSVKNMNNFISGSNITGKFLKGINWNRDLKIPKTMDIRNVVDGDIFPNNKGIINLKKSIEVGHTFQLNNKYSKIMKTYVQNKKGKKKLILMGSYGLGITRIIAALIEQNNDKKGIIWPEEISPFKIAIIPINMYKSIKVHNFTKKIYKKIKKKNIEIILDDRKISTGKIFSDMDLLGIPHIIIISKKNLENNKIEYKSRKNQKSKLINIKNIIEFIDNKLLKINNQ